MRCPIYQSKSIEKIRLVYSMQLSIVALIYMPQTKRLIRNPSRRRLFVRLTMIPSTSNLLLPLLLPLGSCAHCGQFVEGSTAVLTGASSVVTSVPVEPISIQCPPNKRFSSSEGSADGIKTGLHGYEKMKISWLEVF